MADGTGAAPPATPGGGFADLKIRLASGIVLAAGAFALTVAGAGAFAALAGLAAVLVAWEWGRIVRGRASDPAFMVSAVAVLAGVGLMAFGQPLDALAAVVAAVPVVALLAARARPLLSAAGVLYAGLPPLALVWFRADPGFGFQAVIFLILITVATDTGAFFGGRALGGPKLWQRVSPKKTWSGFVSGVTAAGLVGAVYAHAVLGAPAARLGLLALLLGGLSQGGDLLESALKRRFGVKDASNLIPGHGGVMDRIDGLVAVAVAAAAIVLGGGDIGAPARALLFGP